MTGPSTVEIELTDANQTVLDVYVIDVLIGQGTNQNGEPFNLPETGVTTRSTAAAVAGVCAPVLAGAWLTAGSLRKKDERSFFSIFILRLQFVFRDQLQPLSCEVTCSV